MVGEVRLSENVQSVKGATEIVVHPEAAHRVVDRRIDAHGHPVGILSGDLLVHLEEVPVALADDVLSEPPDGCGEVEVDASFPRSDAEALVADLLGRARRDVSRCEVPVGGVAALEVIVPLILGNVARRSGVRRLPRHPDATVVAERLAHQGELRLMCAAGRDARRVDLREARVGERGTTAMRPPDCGRVRASGVGG